MKTLTHIPTGETFKEDHIFGQWPDRSPMTALEHFKQYPKNWIVGVSEQSKSEVFELAKNLLLAFAQGGVNAPASDCMNKAKEMINLKEKI